MHDESVKLSTTTRSRSSDDATSIVVLRPAPLLQAGRRASRALPCAADDATSIVILPALSDSREGSPAPLLHAGPAHPGISPAVFGTRRRPRRQFLFATNEQLSRARNFATRTKQTTSLFLFATNERFSSTSNSATHTNQMTSFFAFSASERLSRASDSAIHTKQATSLQFASFFLFDTNERSPITTHQSLITTHQPGARAFHV